jgi:hypothetical protein
MEAFLANASSYITVEANIPNTGIGLREYRRFVTRFSAESSVPGTLEVCLNRALSSLERKVSLQCGAVAGLVDFIVPIDLTIGLTVGDVEVYADLGGGVPFSSLPTVLPQVAADLAGDIAYCIRQSAAEEGCIWDEQIGGYRRMSIGELVASLGGDLPLFVIFPGGTGPFGNLDDLDIISTIFGAEFGSRGGAKPSGEVPWGSYPCSCGSYHDLAVNQYWDPAARRVRNIPRFAYPTREGSLAPLPPNKIWDGTKRELADPPEGYCVVDGELKPITDPPSAA